MKIHKTMGEYVLQQQHRHDEVGDLARKLAILEQAGVNVSGLYRDNLAVLVRERLDMDAWNLISDIYFDEWIDAAGYNARTGHVYVIQHGKYHKIGVTQNIPKRVSTIQMSTPERIRLVHSFHVCGLYADAYAWEKGLHLRFDTHHIRGEWFDLTSQNIAWIKRITDDAMTHYFDAYGLTGAYPDDIDTHLDKWEKICLEHKKRLVKWKGCKVRVQEDGHIGIGRVVDVDGPDGVGLIVKFKGGGQYWCDEANCRKVS